MSVEAIMQLGLVSHTESDTAKGADYFQIIATLDMRGTVAYGEVSKLMGINNAPVDGIKVYFYNGDDIVKTDGYNMRLFAVTPDKAMKALKKDHRKVDSRRIRMAISLLTDFCNEFGGPDTDEQLGVVFYGH